MFYCNKEFIKDNLKQSPYLYKSFLIDTKSSISNLLKLHDKGCFIYIVKGSLLEYDICKDNECIEISDDELFDYCQDLDWSDTVKNKWIEAYEKKGVCKD